MPTNRRNGSSASATGNKPVGARQLMDFAHTLADASGAAIRPYFRKTLKVANKAEGKDFDPVTAADKAAERVVARAIGDAYPDHGLIGEEYGAHGLAQRYRWVVDPIDGTRAFIMGSPMWGTLIGLLDGDTPVLGLMDQPFTGERVWADQRSAHWRTADGKTRKLRTRPCPNLADAIFSTTHPDLFEPGAEAEGFARIKARARMTRYGGDCYAYCQLAGGFIDIIVEAGLKAHDIVPLLPILQSSGAVVTTWDGKPATAGGRIVAAGDAKLHAAALRLLNG